MAQTYRHEADWALKVCEGVGLLLSQLELPLQLFNSDKVNFYFFIFNILKGLCHQFRITSK
jgi:hypothetical protein